MHLLLLSTILCIVIEFVFLKYFDIIHNLKRKRGIMTTVLIFSVFGVLSNSYNIFNISGNINRILLLFSASFFVLYRPLAYSFILKKLNKKIIVTSYSFYAVDTIFEAIITFIFRNNISNNVRYLLITSFELLILSIITLIILKFKASDSVKNAIFSLKPSSVILIITFIIYCFLFAYSLMEYKQFIKYFAFGTIFIVPLVVLLIFRISINSKKHEETAVLLERQLENQVEYYEKINAIYSELRSFRHDYKNHISCLRILISENSIDEALEYLNDLNSSADNKQKYYDTGNNMINALITEKNEKAASCNARIEFNGTVPASGIKNIDLCTIFSNALDNSVEACAKDNSCSEKIITIDSKYKQGIYLLTISNPCFDDITYDSTGNISTSKANREHHGFGVLNIKKTVKKYDGHTEIKHVESKFELNIDMIPETHDNS